MDVSVGVVSGSEIKKNLDGDVAGRVLQASITHFLDTQNVQTCQAGEEHHPPKGCAVVVVAAGESYKLAVATDDGIAPVMNAGGKRIYATDEDGTAAVAEVRLHPDGTAEMFNAEAHLTLAPDGAITAQNGAASFTMHPDGTFTFHGTGSTFDHPVTMQSTLEVTGAVTSDTSVTAPQITGSTNVTFAGKSAKDHKHNDPQGGQTGTPV